MKLHRKLWFVDLFWVGIEGCSQVANVSETVQPCLHQAQNKDQCPEILCDMKV